ncbi:MAG TPA: hypothetical protein VKW78_06005 [Terriglobales bacterium]|nr:hypothetical protein [Terriglobales bacterium]
MKRYLLAAFVLLLGTSAAFASALGTSARTVIPSQIQQVISVDYRALRNSPTALALKDRVLPDNLKEFETQLKQLGLADDDIEQLTFASFRIKDNSLRSVGIAQGQFPTKKILAKMKLKKISGTKYHQEYLYPMNNGMEMSFIDNYTLLFGDVSAVKAALDARDGYAESLNSNGQMTDMINAVQEGAVWSVLDQKGTQNMLRSTLGDAAQLGDFETVKKRLLGSRYTMDFNDGVDFNLDVVTSDSFTASTLSSLIKAGVLFRKMNANATEKLALDSVTIDSNSSLLTLKFKTDDSKFQSLLHSDLFTAVSR